MHFKNVVVDQINLGKRPTPKTELDKRKSEIQLVTEPPMNRRGKTAIGNPAYNTYHSLKGARAVVRVGKDIESAMIGEFSDNDTCTVSVGASDQCVWLCSAYMDITKPVASETLTKLITRANREKVPLLIGTDLNSHSEIWGCEETNSRGSDVEDLLNIHNLNLLNEGSTPTYTRGAETATIINLTITNQTLLRTRTISEWHVDEEASLSDHKYLQYKLEKAQTKTREIRQLDKVCWDHFRKTMEKELNSRRSGRENIHGKAHMLTKAIDKQWTK